ncbi:MAG: hypothetical protein WB383_01430 [Acidimicrobiales bacterium]
MFNGRRNVATPSWPISRYSVASSCRCSRTRTSSRGAFAAAYQRFRKALDEMASHLSAPIERAKRQLAHIDREMKTEE